MTRRWSLVVIALNLVALVALAFYMPQQMISPGPLMPAHADIGKDCFACHAPLRGATPERCQVCHDVAGIGLLTTTGEPISRSGSQVAFHQQLDEKDCVACHSDHAGPKLTGHAAKPFSHELIATDARAKCEGCHASPKDDFHADIKSDCQQCHRTEGWKPSTFKHDRYFVLDSDHDASCSTCHVDGKLTQYTCYGCHEHTPAKIRAEHVEEGIRDFRNCVKCHRSADDEGKGRRDD